MTVFDVWDKLIESKFADVTIDLPDGGKVIIAPCSMKVHINGIEDCEFFLIISDSLPLTGAETLKEVVDQINARQEVLA